MGHWRSGLTFRRFVGGLAVLVVATGLPLGARPAQGLVPSDAPTEQAALIQNINLGVLSQPSIDSSGVIYLAHNGNLLVADSEIDEEIGVPEPICIPAVPRVAADPTVNMFELTPLGTVVRTWLHPEPFGLTNREPTGLAYNPANDHIFVSRDNPIQSITEMADVDLDGIYDDFVGSFPTSAFGATDPEDVAYDTFSGDLFIANGGSNRSVYRVQTDGTLVSSFDTSVYGLVDVEGIEYRASSDTLLVVDAGPNESVNEFTKDGFLLRRINIGAAQLPGILFVPSDVTLAPASDSSGATSMYIVDRGNDNGNALGDCVSPPMDGRLYEMSAPFAALPAFAPFVDAGPDQTVNIGVGATLNGFVADDGLPTPPALTSTWSMLSGPGIANFADASNPDTTVSFTVSGTYVLALTGDDGPNDRSDTVQVIVNADPVVNQAPVVTAVGDQAVTISAGAALDGTITDDGLPDPPAATTATWSMFSGPGVVTFADPNSADTTAAFSATGTYVLQLAGNDSLLETTATVQVIVNPDPGGGGGGGGGSPPPPPPESGLTCGDTVFPAVTTTFSDLTGLSPEAVHAIDCLAAFGITTGTGFGAFSPYDDVPRWQMAIFLIRQAKAHGIVLPVSRPQGFTDLGGFDSGTQTAINQLAELGITTGTSATTFSPNELVPRWQMAIFLVRLLTQVGVAMPAGIDHGFTDIGALDQLARTSINQLAELGISVGTSPTTFDPLSHVDRWQMALFLNRSLEKGGTP